MVSDMPELQRPRQGFRTLLESVEAAAPTEAIEVVTHELAEIMGARAVSFLIADFSGNAVVRFGRAEPGTGGWRLRAELPCRCLRGPTIGRRSEPSRSVGLVCSGLWAEAHAVSGKPGGGADQGSGIGGRRVQMCRSHVCDGA